MKEITLEEYMNRVKSIVFSKTGDKKYVDKLDKDIKRSYNEAKRLKDVLGYGTPDPNGYALGILMMYPEVP